MRSAMRGASRNRPQRIIANRRSVKVYNSCDAGHGCESRENGTMGSAPIFSWEWGVTPFFLWATKTPRDCPGGGSVGCEPKQPVSNYQPDQLHLVRRLWSWLAPSLLLSSSLLASSSPGLQIALLRKSLLAPSSLLSSSSLLASSLR